MLLGELLDPDLATHVRAEALRLSARLPSSDRHLSCLFRLLYSGQGILTKGEVLEGLRDLWTLSGAGPQGSDLEDLAEEMRRVLTACPMKLLPLLFEGVVAKVDVPLWLPE